MNTEKSKSIQTLAKDCIAGLERKREKLHQASVLEDDAAKLDQSVRSKASEIGAHLDMEPNTQRLIQVGAHTLRISTGTYGAATVEVLDVIQI